MSFLIHTIYYASFVLIPLFFILSYGVYSAKKTVWKVTFSLLLILNILGLYTRFIEPYQIQIKHQKIEIFGFEEPLKIVLIADPHLGLFKGEHYFSRILEKTTQINPDAVFFLGDFVYKVETETQLEEIFRPLSNFTIPSYGVLGNHDFGHGMSKEKDWSKEITNILLEYNIDMIDNQFRAINWKGKNITLYGIGSFLGKDAKVDHLNEINTTDNVITIFHNPDVLELIPPQTPLDISFAGHTHCGQIRLPGYQNFIPTTGNYDSGLTQENITQLYISCGLGEVGLPFRFLNPPELTVVEIY